MAKTKKIDFEQALADLENLVKQMEQGDVSLEESLKLYEQGVLLTRDCQAALQAAEQKVQVLMQQAGEATLVDFDTDNSPS